MMNLIAECTPLQLARLQQCKKRLNQDKTIFYKYNYQKESYYVVRYIKSLLQSWYLL